MPLCSLPLAFLVAPPPFRRSSIPHFRFDWAIPAVFFPPNCRTLVAPIGSAPSLWASARRLKRPTLGISFLGRPRRRCWWFPPPFLLCLCLFEVVSYLFSFPCLFAPDPPNASSEFAASVTVSVSLFDHDSENVRLARSPC